MVKLVITPDLHSGCRRFKSDRMYPTWSNGYLVWLMTKRPAGACTSSNLVVGIGPRNYNWKNVWFATKMLWVQAPSGTFMKPLQFLGLTIICLDIISFIFTMYIVSTKNMYLGLSGYFLPISFILLMIGLYLFIFEG